MKWYRPARIVKFAVLAVAMVAIVGYVVMGLWNWLTPPLFGWRIIGFWQALGILLLCKILFGGFRPGGGHQRHWRRGMIERWEQMTPEEREKFRASMGRCGPFGSHPPGPEQSKL